MSTGDGDKEKGKGKQKLSPYYKNLKKGGAAAAIAKREMASYFRNENGNNKRGESEQQHIARMKQIEKAQKAK